MGRKIKFFLLISFIIAAVVSIKLSGLDRYLDQEKLRTWISSYGAWGPIAYIILYSIAPSLMLPGVPITVAGGRFSHYFFASFIFMLPGVVAYIVFSSSLLGLFRGNVSGEFVIGLVLVVIVSAIPIIYRRKSH
ncbi:MAG: hypothetical protein HY786_02635 [Deltaproteobacteria bacterium]|nr:hypothetical protein [Deltaproteobacteria bacterium]